MRSRSEKEGIGKVVEISVLGIATRLLRARRSNYFTGSVDLLVVHDIAMNGGRCSFTRSLSHALAAMAITDQF